MSVGANVRAVKVKVARNFPKTISISVMGLVSSSSIVPDFFSSENDLIVIAGMKNNRINGIISNAPLMETNPITKRLLVKNHPVIARNTTITMYATGE